MGVNQMNAGNPAFRGLTTSEYYACSLRLKLKNGPMLAYACGVPFPKLFI